MPDDKSPPPRTRQAQLPESLQAQIESFREQLWKIKLAEAVLAGFFGLLFSYLLVFGLDRVWATPGVVRLTILLAGTSLFVLFAPYWIHRWVFGHRREDQLARLIARRFPKLGDRLLGVVELQDQRENVESLSPELRLAAMRRVAAEAKGRNFDDALPASRHRTWSLGVLATFGLAAATLVFVPKAGLNALKRWILPLSDTPRYTFTRIHDLPDRMVVPFGQPFEIAVRLHEDSEQKPTGGTARYGSQDPLSAELAADTYTFAFPGQQADGMVAITIGDVRERILVQPVDPPTLQAATLRVEYPEYLQRSPMESEIKVGVTSILTGSKVSLGGVASRELASAALTRTILPFVEEFTPDPESAGPQPEPTQETEEVAVAVKDARITSAAVTIADHPSLLELHWTDSLGLQDEGGFRLRLEPVKDEPPTPYIQGTDRQRVMLEEETVEFEVVSEDDYGVREIGIEWRGQFTKPTDETPANGELKLGTGSADRVRLSSDVAFSPSTLGITPQKLIVRAYAEDYLPGRGRVYSQPLTLFILTRDEHATLLKNQFDRIIGELEDLARREQNNLDENRRIEREDDEDLQGDEVRERLEKQELSEAESAERMRDLSERMEQLFKDSVRNGEIGEDTMKKMSEALQNMQELGKEDLPKVEQELQESQDDRSTPDQARRDLEEAIEAQQEALEKMRETIEQSNEANRNFEASTFVNRLKRAASEEEGIGRKLVDLIDNIVGLSPEAMDPADQRVVGELATQQRRTASDVRWIQEDLGHFYARTQKEIHKKLLVEMQESRIDTALDDNRERIATNRTYEAIVVAQKWADQLREWVKLLEGDQAGGGGAGGGGDGGGGLNDEDFEFMLKVMRMIQQEQDIRARTRALEQLRRAQGLVDEPAAAPTLPIP